MKKSKHAKAPRIPIAERRGLHGPFQVDLSFYALLVRADITTVADAFAREMKAKKHSKGLSRADLPDCDPDGNLYFPFQLRGHLWTTVVHRMDDKFRFSPLLAKRLSEHLKSQTIFAGDHDTGGTTDWVMYERGKLAEVFHWHDWEELHLLTPAEVVRAEKESFLKYNPCAYYAFSNVRKLPVNEYKALRQGVEFHERVNYLLDSFLKCQDAFLSFNLMDEPGREYHPLAEASDDDIARVDVVKV
jgi:hypothetical protein